MSERRPFREIKLQWLQLLSCDRTLSDCAKSVALYIVTTHLNGHTEKAWPSYQTIADSMGKSVKTIQRAVRELETSGWLEVRRGNGVGHNTEYRPSAGSILRAAELREKTDKYVTLRPREGGQACPGRGAELSGKGGQNCPANLEKEKIYKPNGRADVRKTDLPSPAIPQVFLAGGQETQVSEWRSWLDRHNLPSLEELTIEEIRNGRSGFRLPSYWPPKDHDPKSDIWAAYLARQRRAVARLLPSEIEYPPEGGFASSSRSRWRPSEVHHAACASTQTRDRLKADRLGFSAGRMMFRTPEAVTDLRAAPQPHG